MRKYFELKALGYEDLKRNGERKKKGGGGGGGGKRKREIRYAIR